MCDSMTTGVRMKDARVSLSFSWFPSFWEQFVPKLPSLFQLNPNDWKIDRILNFIPPEKFNQVAKIYYQIHPKFSIVFNRKSSIWNLNTTTSISFSHSFQTISQVPVTSSIPSFYLSNPVNTLHLKMKKKHTLSPWNKSIPGGINR